MHIEIAGDDSISRQARAYAEYRLFAALSQCADSTQVEHAALVLCRASKGPHCDSVVCRVTVALHNGEVARFRTSGPHPYAAINRAVERLRLNAWPFRHQESRRAITATE